MASHDPAHDAEHLPDATSGAGGNGRNGNGHGMLATIESHLPAVPSAGWMPAPPRRPEILSAKANPVELLHAVRRRWTLAIGLGTVVSTLATALVWYFVPVQYEAYALLRVASTVPSVIEKTRGGADEFTTFKRTQVQLILSNFVLQRAVKEPDLIKLSALKEHFDEPAAWLKSKLLIDYPDDSEVLRIAIKAKKQSDAIKIVNVVVDKYLSEVVAHERKLRDDHNRTLQDTYQRYLADCKNLEEGVRKAEKLYGTSGSESAQQKKRLAIQKLGQLMEQRHYLSTQLTGTDMEIALAEFRRDHKDEDAPPDALVDLELGKDPMVMKFTERLAGLNEAHTDLVARSRNPQKDKRLDVVRKSIQRTEEMLDDRRNTLRPRLIEAQQAAGPRMTLPNLRARREYLDEQFKHLEEQIEAEQENLMGLEKFSIEVISQLEELNAKQQITRALRSELDRIGVERLARERVTQLDDAVLASSGGDAIRKYVAVAFTAIFSFGLVVLGVAFVEFQARKVNSVNEVQDGLGIRVMGELPSVSGRVWKRVKGAKGGAVLKALMAERVDGARTNLIHTTAIEPPRVVMVTSAQPREGKTTTATQLAASLARSGRRTVLIDADIRNPGAHLVFELASEPGLCELLRGEADRDAVIHPTRTANLWLLPAGRCDLRSVQALSTSYLGTAIAALCVQFDYVVIDSGPVLKVADALMVGQHVDAAVVSVLRDVSTVPDVYEACERLRSVGITVLGAVVNGVKDDVARHGVEILMAETDAGHEAEKTG